jgi:aminoglycoside phosphotransferase (APT) family kinase protein
MALEALLVWGADELGISRAHLGCHVENTASRRVAEKCHFGFVGVVGDELRFSRELDTTVIRDERAHRWAAEALNASSVREVGSLTFGVTSDVRLLDADGEPVVLRRYTSGPVEEGSRLIEAELVALTEAAAVFGELVPKPLVSDASGLRAGRPALLMSYLPGSALIHELDLRRSADALTNLHRSTVPTTLPPAHEWLDYEQLTAPAWTESRAAWQALAELLRGPAPTATAVFLHADYHPGNLLWQDGKLTGIVDWPFASRGPAAIDVAHMRTNLALIEGPDQADAFLRAYSELNPTYVHDPWWDARDLCSFGDDFGGVLAFNAFGARFTSLQLQKRADAYAIALAERHAPGLKAR